MRRGFSLLEVIVATVILATITGTTVEILRQGFRASEESQKRTIAYNLAREKLEEYSGPPSYVPPINPYTEAYGTITGFSNFKRVVTVSSFSWPGCPGGCGVIRQINVTVYWDSDRKSQSFTTLKADY